MINIEMAKDYIKRAKRYAKEAERALFDGDFPTTVRRSQEALELAVKAVLRYLAIEYPKEHDVGDALSEVAEKVPDYLRSRIPEMRALLSELARVRGPAFYGYEREGIPASKAFSNEYASSTFEKVSRMVNLCEKYLQTMPEL